MDDVYGGFRIIESTRLVEQFRFPRTKKRRIRKKWAKRSQNYRPSRRCFVDERLRVIYAHPVFVAELRKQAAKWVK